MHFIVFCIIIYLTIIYQYAEANPIATSGPNTVVVGKDVLLTCVVMEPYLNNTVIWKKDSTHILTAGMLRITPDQRISILHDSATPKSPMDGEVWVLFIKNLQPSDTGTYTCEVNSDPVIKSFHPLYVKRVKLPPKTLTTPSASDKMDVITTIPTDDNTNKDKSNENTNDDDDFESMDYDPPSSNSFIHDFTDCCLSFNVTSKCLGFCAVHNIIDGTTGIEPELCEVDFPNIVRCMADGRNHLPCCERKQIPDLCQDMCIGEYTPFNDYVKSRVSCVAHTLPALKCILEGIQHLPSEPQNVYVEPLNEKSLQISWSAPEDLGDTIRSYTVNVTTLLVFDQDGIPQKDAERTITVSGDTETAIVNDLKPFTMYSVLVTAQNEHGSSLPSIRVRALTLDSGVSTQQTSVAVVPVLPDVRGCCMKHGITHRTCLDRMCDPKKADFTEIPDLMVCAPWANITFSCLVNNIDHTPCCMARGIPNGCLSFCAGNITAVTFSMFKCLQYMSDYSSCLLQGYGVLAGPPSRVKAPLIASHFAIIEWNQPKILPDTVTSYRIYLRKLGGNEEYTIMEKERPPVILEHLDSGIYYETFVIAVNAHGKGGASPRLVFQTKHEVELESPMPNYNITSCCHASGLLPTCMALCTYDIKMSDLKELSQICLLQMGVLTKCAAGGRDHTPCCNRRGVPKTCVSLCRGVLPQPNNNDCLSYAGNILQCLEEGTGNIPGPVADLHVTSVKNTSISLTWVPYDDDSNDTNNNNNTINTTDNKPIDYLVQYGKVNNMTMYETIIKLENEINTTDTDIDLNNLETNSVYRIMVVARGIHGTSLPSSMLLINTSRPVDYSSPSYGAPSPPHSLTISTHSATWVTIAWQPPEFSHPHEAIVYKVYHKSTSADKFSIIMTKLLWARLNNLKPNSQHVIYIVAIGKLGTSLPSETLVAWTDPALPAFVDPPTIHPIDIIAEGGSMTILCLALGNPAPTISLYVGGHLVRQDTSRHMVTIIHNVTTDMEHVSCYADNGYGIPMQASKKVNISFSPRIQASGITMALLEEQVDLKCTVKAKPAPKVIFWRDHEGRVPVIAGNNYDITYGYNKEDPTVTIMTLSILKLTHDYVGEYFCHAENALGTDTRAVSVRIRNTPAVHNVQECCVAQNVSAACMDACSFYIDFDLVKDRPECLMDFDKLMKCAADGSDHRSCCATANVPRNCLNWCRGETVNGYKGTCILQYTKKIIECFQSNREILPGPPQNLDVKVLTDDQVQITWAAPKKNPHMVEGYRIYWHEADVYVTDNGNNDNINTFNMRKSDTTELSIKITDLLPSITYQVAIAAGNQHGASMLSDPITFTLGDHHITSTYSSNTTGMICGIIFGLLSIGLIILAILFYKRKRKSIKSANGVAFENPSYLREVNMEHVQISSVSDGSTDWRQERLQAAATTAVGGGSSSMNEHQHQNNTISNNNNNNNNTHTTSMVPMATEVNPSLYEELKLGQEGAGFKRLVS